MDYILDIVQLATQNLILGPLALRRRITPVLPHTIILKV